MNDLPKENPNFRPRSNEADRPLQTQEHNMPRTKTTRSQIMRAKLATFSSALGAAVLMAVVAMPAHAQAFADLKTASVDYSQAALSPRKTCEALGKFKSKEIAQITAAAMR